MIVHQYPLVSSTCLIELKRGESSTDITVCLGTKGAAEVVKVEGKLIMVVLHAELPAPALIPPVSGPIKLSKGAKELFVPS